MMKADGLSGFVLHHPSESDPRLGRLALGTNEEGIWALQRSDNQIG